MPVTWEYQDVHNQFADSADEIAYDATGLVDFLEQRQQDTGLAYSFKLNKRGELSSCRAYGGNWYGCMVWTPRARQLALHAAQKHAKHSQHTGNINNAVGDPALINIS